ncbi:nitrous oxide reductase accessory protein NosL [Riemerella columbina]|uniref:nitrous oxide reductase accessory protein NosL n=1 Tax=Riemerella columbina TaxID=103810 RepID=UPI00266F656B|nr:nitrous oxide reductase accessory protein NosL [Riemerella columbina]WKS95759.1 nitrous oxide reductase accessory protein NosL [Riemerella columbina]
MKRHTILSIASLFALSLTACTQEGPQPIQFGKDDCDHCKMTITEDSFATELVTDKGRVYKFDDLSCMEAYEKEHPEHAEKAHLYVSDFLDKKLIPLETATLISGGEIKSPMNGNTAAFSDSQKAEEYAQKLNAQLLP